MNKRSVSRKSAIICGIVVILCSCGSVARADFTYGPPTKVPNINTDSEEFQPQISRNGLELYFLSDRVDSNGGGYDIWVSQRTTARGSWSTPIRLPSPVNTAGPETSPSLSADGLELYFSNGYADLWVSTRVRRDDPWSEPVKLPPPVNSENSEDTPCISADGLSLYFMSDRPGGGNNPSNSDIFVTTRTTKDDPWGEPVKLGPNVNSAQYEFTPFISPDGLLLFFSRGFMKAHVHVCGRKTTADPWGPAEFFTGVNSGTGVWHNSPGFAEWNLSFAYGDSKLYFGRATDLFSNDKDIWQVDVTPVVDFNGDGKVDEKDFLAMTGFWGQTHARYDIGPSPLGDGAVDAHDLVVFLETMEGRDFPLRPVPNATEVSREAILIWTAPRFAQTHDVYFGRSFLDVSGASRTNPAGVLVSQGQSATTYDPGGLLESGRNYYWRVDFVGAGPNPTIYKGPVLDFSTEAFAYSIKNVIATASSTQGNMGPEKTVDGSGLDENNGHSTDEKDMWLSMTDVQPHWIQYRFDRVYALHELWVWNSNLVVEPLVGFGAKTVKIEYSSDGTTWTPLAQVPEFARAPGKAGSTAGTIVSFGGVPARYIKLTIEKNWGIMPQTGLSEVRFFHLPDESATQP